MEIPRIALGNEAGVMVDRFNCFLFLYTLRQMRDLRRYALGVTIQNARQVNIGQQQVNVVDGVQPLAD